MALKWRFADDVGGAGRQTGLKTKPLPEVIKGLIQTCAYCGGGGEKPPGAKCPVCRGKGEVNVKAPAVRCAMCKGRGTEGRGSLVTCNACRGTGYISVEPPLTWCPACRGTGKTSGARLVCRTCSGAGVTNDSL